MSSIIKSAGDATSNVFTTVGSIAEQLTRTVNTGGQALDMLNSFVSTARTKQIARTTVDLETFYDELVEETSMANAKRQAQLQQELANDAGLKTLFTENHNKLSAIISNLRAPQPE